MTAGPALERVMRRLAGTPDEFLAEPRIGQAGELVTAALVGDLFTSLGHSAEARWLDGYVRPAAGDRNRLILVAVAVWLLADSWVAEAHPDPSTIVMLLDERVVDLATASRADLFISDVERREELARTVIAALGLLPDGETATQAADRLSAVSAAERRRLLRASQEAEERASAIREALIRKAAEESADKYTRE